MQARLLQRAGNQREYLAMLGQLDSAIELWQQSRDTVPVETAAYVLQTRPEMYRVGDVSCRGCLLVCPDQADSPDLRDDLGQLAERLLKRIESNSADYEDVYLRSLLSRNDGYPWREVPERLTGDRTLWVTDLRLDRIFLPDGKLGDNWVKCLVAPSGSAHAACLCDETPHDVQAPVAKAPDTSATTLIGSFSP